MMLSIKINEPQPKPCPKCNSFEGYQYSDYMTIHYTSFHSEVGKYDGGEYSAGSKILNKGKSAFCCNCGTRLPFKLIRTDSENVD
jgi:hypothetical protein